MEPKLEITSIWEDAHLFEVRVSASNGSFSGVADCYTMREEMARLSELINGFPKTINQQVSHSPGEDDHFSYFNLALRCKDRSGHVIMRIKIAHIVTYTDERQDRHIAEFDMPVEPYAIDGFAKSLCSLSQAKIGEVRATLAGKT